MLLGVIITFLCGLLLINSFNWKWRMGKSRSFRQGKVYYHKNNSIDLSWMKIIFYPITVSGTALGIYYIYLGCRKED